MTRHPTVAAAAIALALVTAVRADSPAAPATSSTIDTTGRQVHVFNTQFRGIIDPDIIINPEIIINPDVEPSPAYGHVQIKLTEQEDGSYAVEWNGRLFNPDGEEFMTGLLLALPSEIPIEGEGPLSRLVTAFFRGAAANCGVIDFDSQGVTDEENLPADVGLNMIINPDVHVAVLVSAEGTGVLGRFGPDSPENASDITASSFDGRPVRCSAGE